MRFLLVFWASLIAADLSLANEPEPTGVVYLSDMSLCEPAEALSGQWEPEKWRLIPYQTKQLSGSMLAATSIVEAPEIRLPLAQNGSYAIHLGIWNPHLMYDGQPIIKARLSSRAVFQQIHPGKSPDTQDATYLEEVHLCDADLSEEQYLAFGKSNGLHPCSAYIAYVKLVPLSDDQIAVAQKERTDSTRKNLVATFDGSSVFHFSECSTTNHLLEWVEKLRDSDTKKILWAVTYGDRTGFPTSNKDLTYLGAEDQIQASPLTFGNDYRRGHVQMQTFFRKCADQGIVPQQLLAEHAHRLGMKFDLMYRIGFLGGLGLSELWNDNYVQKHPHVRQVTHSGNVLQKASLAFPEVQNLILEQIQESCQLIDTDGINLCFVRGPHFLLWEKPVREAFESKYGGSSTDLAENDPRIDIVRGEIVTNFLKRVKSSLADIGKTRGRNLTMSVWVWPHEQNVWLGRRPADEGLDVEEWIRQGLLESVICQEGIDESYIELGKKHGCEFVLFTGYRGEKAMSPATLGNAFQRGVKSFACWDIDAMQHDPQTWRWLRKTGDPETLSRFERESDLLKPLRIPLLELNGIKVDEGLVDAVYSGG